MSDTIQIGDRVSLQLDEEGDGEVLDVIYEDFLCTTRIYTIRVPDNYVYKTEEG